MPIDGGCLPACKWLQAASSILKLAWHTQVWSCLKWAAIEILAVTEAEQVCKHDYVRQVLQGLGHL
jgi:hypothetical protein